MSKRKLKRCKLCRKALEDDIMYICEPNIMQFMEQHGVCYDCACWHEFLSTKPKNIIVIDGCMYEGNVRAYYPRKNNNPTLQKISDNTPCVAVNFKKIGAIPKYLIKDFPNQYTFINPKLYTIMSKIGEYKCTRKGCWDRYHCIWYDESIEKIIGPWNEIPHYHKVGDEKCSIFFNKKDKFKNVDKFKQ